MTALPKKMGITCTMAKQDKGFDPHPHLKTGLNTLMTLK
jgi:hypothetical protein